MKKQKSDFWIVVLMGSRINWWPPFSLGEHNWDFLLTWMLFFFFDGLSQREVSLFSMNLIILFVDGDITSSLQRWLIFLVFPPWDVSMDHSSTNYIFQRYPLEVEIDWEKYFSMMQCRSVCDSLFAKITKKRCECFVFRMIVRSFYFSFLFFVLALLQFPLYLCY